MYKIFPISKNVSDLKSSKTKIIFFKKVLLPENARGIPPALYSVHGMFCWGGEGGRATYLVTMVSVHALVGLFAKTVACLLVPSRGEAARARGRGSRGTSVLVLTPVLGPDWGIPSSQYQGRVPLWQALPPARTRERTRDQDTPFPRKGHETRAQ